MSHSEPLGPVAEEGSAWSNELSGNVFGPSVQAGAIHGGVHVYRPAAEPPPVPRQLPAPPHRFTNRGAELEQLDEVLANGSTGIAVLTGPGGVGKTALAIYWAYGVQDRFPGGQLYVDLGGFSEGPPLDPAEVVGSFLRALGVRPDDLPVTFPEQLARYRSVTAGRPLLMILDNAYSAAQVRVLVPAAGSSVVVVTSRSRLVGLVPDGARLIDVAPLPEAESVALLTRRVDPTRVAREQDRVAELVRFCAGLPIALCLAAARLAARPRLSIGTVVSELADETNRLRRLAVPEGVSVQAAFDMSYRALGPQAAMLYRRLALHPGQEFGLGPVSALMPDATGDDRSQAVEALLDANLLEEVDEARFRFHDLVRLHARQKAEADDREAVREAALRAIVEWYFAAAHQADMMITPYRRRVPYEFAARLEAVPVLPNRHDALEWLKRERLNLLAAGRAAFDHGYAELAWHLSDVLWPLFLYGKHYRDQMEADRRAVAAARAWGNQWAEAGSLKRLSRVWAIAGDYTAAREHALESIRLYRAVQDTRGVLDAQEALALVYRDTGQQAKAIAAFTDLLAANREYGDERVVALILINLGTLLSADGQCREAIPLLMEAKDILGRLSAIDPYNEARALIGLAGAYLGAGDVSAADEAATAAMNRMGALGSAHDKAEAIRLLGQIAERRGDLATARTHYRNALAVFEALGSPRAAPTRSDLARLTTDESAT
jgi:Tfp pilus assembly protein PilF